jgi:hypothetical protein
MDEEKEGRGREEGGDLLASLAESSTIGSLFLGYAITCSKLVPFRIKEKEVIEGNKEKDTFSVTNTHLHKSEITFLINSYTIATYFNYTAQ